MPMPSTNASSSALMTPNGGPSSTSRNGAAVASEVSETLWKGLEQAFGDLRAALLDARAAATR